jgi:hypothetical protein
LPSNVLARTAPLISLVMELCQTKRTNVRKQSAFNFPLFQKKMGIDY